MQYNVRSCRGVEQLKARWIHDPKVVGLNPTPATISKGYGHGISYTRKII